MAYLFGNYCVKKSSTLADGIMEKFRDRVKKKSIETFSSLSIRNYRLYYIGQIISTSGTFMQTIAQGWLVLKLTNSGTALGVVVAVQYVPLLILGSFGGVIADRYPKRTILFFTQSIAVLASSWAYWWRRISFNCGWCICLPLCSVWSAYLTTRPA